MATRVMIRKRIADAVYYASGMKRINGGYADFIITSIHKPRNPLGKILKVTGYVITGEQDCGDGHSSEDRSKQTFYLKETKGKLEFLTYEERKTIGDEDDED